MKKLFMILMMCIISSCSYYGAVNEKGERIDRIEEAIQITNSVENEKSENTEIKPKEQEIVENKENEVSRKENNEQKIQKSNNVQEIKKSTQVENSTKKASKSVKNSNTETKQEKAKETNTQKETSKKTETEQKKSSATQTEQKNQTTQKQEKSIYCIDGGKVHIAGDGENEHGYYKTYDEAFKAYEEYVKDWDYAHYKINQCFCGLYYFCATK